MADLTLRNRSAEILSSPNNQELDIDFRATSSAPQLNPSFYEPPLMQACQDYQNAYQQRISLYNLILDNNETNLYIYNTETEIREVKTLQTPERLDFYTCITQLPNGKPFCFGNDKLSGITVLIDTNGEIEVLPSGTPCGWSSFVYINNSVYCFGGKNNEYALNLSCRFDLDQNRWIQLTPMPEDNVQCNSVMFNRYILISGWHNRNILLYSIDIDSFSTIPYEFTIRKRKILINAGRLYLIECDEGGNIYESKIGSYTNWRPIGKTT